MNELLLNGCASTPLGSYLKALGVFRVLAEQLEPEIRCHWKENKFFISTSMDERDVRNFFLYDYRPTPIISPWNGRAGFLEGENADDSKRKGAVIVREASSSKGVRFSLYRSVLDSIKRVPIVEELNRVRTEVKLLEAAKKKKQSYDEQRLKEAKSEERLLKSQLVISLRSELADDFIPWLDACLVLTGNESTTAPLLGSGGNEGSMDFSVNHLGLLSLLIDPDTDQPSDQAIRAIDSSIFGVASPISVHGNPGFFNPSTVGGVNMGVGFSGGVGDNGWDTVLMLEGVLLFAATASRRLNSNFPPALSQPFMVESVSAGHGGVAASESVRPEFWAPLWSGPTSLGELRALLAEGRATVGRRQSQNGLDMARAATTLGVNRGLFAFQRFGLFERRGQGYYVAAPLGLMHVASNLHSELINELEQRGWLSHFRRFAQGDKVARRFVVLRKRLEDALFDLASRAATPGRMQALLGLLGEIQKALSASTKAREAVGPVPRLSARWIMAADDGSTAFRIASALASLHGEEGHPLPLRSQLFPVHPRSNAWLETACGAKGARTRDPACRIRLHTPEKGQLTDTLIALLERRLWLAEQLDFRDKPLKSVRGVGLDDFNVFLMDSGMDEAIVNMLPGFSLCEIPPTVDHAAGGAVAPAAVALLKLNFTPDAVLRDLAGLAHGQHMPVPPGLVALLASGNANQAERAVQLAWRRLQGSMLSPVIPLTQLPSLAGLDPRRVSAALLIPLSFGATGVIARTVLKQPETAGDAA